jgi:hypothetical protein
VTIDDLREEIVKELGEMRGEFVAGYAAITQRLDKMDLNGSAKYLKQFGEFLEVHPQFMARQAEEEADREDREIAFTYFKKKFHITNMKVKFSWLAAGIATGFLFALGNALFEIGPHFEELAKHLIGGGK